jgi:N-acetylglucosaminyl-diphospho-decaprenol L-rhamnosyltransferase
VSWNSGELLLRCVQSLSEYPPTDPWELLIIDNASSDFETKRVLTQIASWPPVSACRIVHNQDNLGFAKAANQRLRLSGGEFALLLNPDTQVTRGALQVLVDVIASDASVGACAPRLVTSSGTPQPSVWREANIAHNLLDGLPLHRILPKGLRGRLLLGRHWAHDQARTVAAFSGAAMMVRMAMVEEVGALDERFEMYGEDAEWCFRMTRRGWVLRFEPQAEVIHHGARSALQRWSDDERRLREAQANVSFQLLCYSPLRAASNLASSALVLALMGIWQDLHGKRSDLMKRVLSVQLEGLRRAARSLLGREVRP